MKTFVHGILAALVAAIAIGSTVFALAFFPSSELGPVLCSILVLSPLAFALLLYNAFADLRELD